MPFGGGSGIVGGTTAVPGCISLDTKRLDRLRLDPISRVARAQAGIFGVDLERRLNAEAVLARALPTVAPFQHGRRLGGDAGLRHLFDPARQHRGPRRRARSRPPRRGGAADATESALRHRPESGRALPRLGRDARRDHRGRALGPSARRAPGLDELRLPGRFGPGSTPSARSSRPAPGPASSASTTPARRRTSSRRSTCRRRRASSSSSTRGRGSWSPRTGRRWAIAPVGRAAGRDLGDEPALPLVADAVRHERPGPRQQPVTAASPTRSKSPASGETSRPSTTR